MKNLSPVEKVTRFLDGSADETTMEEVRHGLDDSDSEVSRALEQIRELAKRELTDVDYEAMDRGDGCAEFHELLRKYESGEIE